MINVHEIFVFVAYVPMFTGRIMIFVAEKLPSFPSDIHLGHPAERRSDWRLRPSVDTGTPTGASHRVFFSGGTNDSEAFTEIGKLDTKKIWLYGML